MLTRIATDIGLDPRRFNRIRYVKKLRVLRDYKAALLPNLGYILTDPEIDNFTYELENEDRLARWIAETFEADYAQVCEHLIEARSDQRIYEPLRRVTSRWSAKTSPPLGRRVGWYVITRLLKPARVVETGIHDGIGSLVFLAALERNANDGVDGTLVSFDIDKRAGWIVGQHPRWSRRIGDSRILLRQALAEAPVQIFLHDSLHTVEHESFELEAAASLMERASVLISDNSHVTTVLRDVAERHSRRYSFFREQPRAHFYPGAGIGAAL
jgi:hypothetical protein